MEPYHDSSLDKLATRLFREFARFEYALKAAGYLMPRDGDAKPDWTAFAIRIAPAFDRPLPEEVRVAIEYLLAKPPKKQVARNGVLQWEEPQQATTSISDQALRHVRRVRNNLFHGGKFNGNWFAPERSEDLLRHSLAVLEYALATADDVKAAYDH
jgi:hypothetical protein